MYAHVLLYIFPPLSSLVNQAAFFSLILMHSPPAPAATPRPNHLGRLRRRAHPRLIGAVHAGGVLDVRPFSRKQKAAAMHGPGVLPPASGGG